MSCVETSCERGAQTRILLLTIRTTDTNAILDRVRAVLPAETEIRVEHAEEPLLPALTTRQADILALLLRDLSNKEIGRVLAISHFTVRNHVSQLLRLLNLPSRKAAISALSGRCASIAELLTGTRPLVAQSLPEKAKSEPCG